MKAAKPTKRKQQKVPARKGIEKTCFDLWSLCVRAKQRKCQECGSESGLQAHHIRSRTHAATRFDLSNGLCLCSKCHCLQKFNTELFQDRVISIVGDEEYRRLKKKSLTLWKITTPMLNDIRNELKDTLRILESDYGVLK